jgi:mono/diheme cytochrome c family protein
MRLLAAIFVIALLAGVAAATYVFSGAYDIGADVPHAPFVADLIETARDRSIRTHAEGIAAPPLGDPKQVSEGAAHYAQMCAGCHLAPGKQDTEMRRGLYPQPPRLAEVDDLSPAEEFWIIKHGIKLTAMPAWGVTHDDAKLWAIVAFLQKLPKMSPDAYRQMTAGAGDEEAHEHAETGPDPAKSETGSDPVKSESGSDPVKS